MITGVFIAGAVGYMLAALAIGVHVMALYLYEKQKGKDK